MRIKFNKLAISVSAVICEGHYLILLTGDVCGDVNGDFSKEVEYTLDAEAETAFNTIVHNGYIEVPNLSIASYAHEREIRRAIRK